ncbi:hypothetical protein KP509_12G061100 [Ceratopteris richardii]|uniref:Protein kinase domain-containing protein n=1 Tax=Ceratopteris richardii TaxID=49495 RepID=A0A8T2TM46_CERRI|nr:hypothetical protein KP509_12G061100 [Ceratopteris richardii]
MQSMRLLLVLRLVLHFLFPGISALTDPGDVSGLQTLYATLGSPLSLASWDFTNGDPCGQSWKGIVCVGSAVTEINLAGLGLNGQLSYNLESFKSLHVLDLSNNQLSGSIPYSLPSNLQTLNLAKNNISDSLPYSLSTLTGLVNLYVGSNFMTGNLVDVFSNLGNLTVLDVSFNSMSGDLPQSLSALYSLSSLYLQNNGFTGDLNVLANLNLQNLNVENNNFTGWLPASFSSIPNLRFSNNSFSSSPAPPPPPFTPPPPTPPSFRQGPISQTPSESPVTAKKSSNKGGAIAGIVISLLLGFILAGAVIVFLNRRSRHNLNDEEKFQSTAPVLGVYTPEEPVKGKNEYRASLLPSDTVTRPPPSGSFKEPILDKILGRKISSRRGKNTISASAISISDLQLATNSFSQEHLLGTSVLGPVYRGELPDGKLLAIRNIDLSVAPSLEREEEFIEIVSNISHLRHTNLAELVGYCADHGQRLLIYDYFQRGSLSDILHVWDESFRTELTWNIRVKITLGMARALEYLHEECQPAIIHRNFKSANILLDEDFNPHLSDSGIASLISSTVIPTGYRAPECTMTGIYTWQSDVYSFGVVMLELLTGRKPMDSTRPRAEQSLVRWATPQLHDFDSLASMVDPFLNGTCPAKSLSRYADIIAQCIQPEMEFRPPMSEVVQSLVRLMQRASLKRRPGED